MRAAHHHVFDHLVKRGLGARHLHADIEALAHLERGVDRAEVGGADVHRNDVRHLPGKVEAGLVDIGDDDVAGPTCRATAAAMMPMGRPP